MLFSMKERSYLRRLSAEAYQGEAIVHWSITVDRRQTGWLDDAFHSTFREMLLHSLARYKLSCSCYCLMPDHMHLLLVGLASAPDSDQRNAIKFLRTCINRTLAPHWKLQQQPYDHVLKEHERQRDAFASVAYYILANPERSRLVGEGCWSDYPYAGSMIAGYPDLDCSSEAFWDTYWKIVDLEKERYDHEAQSP